MGIVPAPAAPATDWLLNQLAIRNPDLISPLNELNVSCGAPLALTPPIGGFALGAPNTQVTLTPNPGTGYAGTVAVYYPRVDLGAQFAATGIVPSFENSSALISWPSLQEALNARYGTFLNDPVDTPTEPFPDLNLASSVTLVLPGTSLLYQGQLVINITEPTLVKSFPVNTLSGLLSPQLALSSAFTVTSLNGLSLT